MTRDSSDYYSDSGTLWNGRRLCIERLSQWWWNTLWWQKTSVAICDNPFSTILTLSHSLQLMITMTNTVWVKLGANNSFMTNNYSNTSTQHMTTGERHWETLSWCRNSFQMQHGSRQSQPVLWLQSTQEWKQWTTLSMVAWTSNEHNQSTGSIKAATTLLFIISNH